MPLFSDAKPLLDPPAHAWLTPERLSRLEHQLGSALPILLLSGHFRPVVDYWIRSELACEARTDPNIWPVDEKLNLLVELKREWLEKNPNGHSYLSEQELEIKLSVNPGSQQWARYQWGHRLETIYLEAKEKLDTASFWMLGLNDKDLGSELYYRLCANECTFKEVVDQYGSKIPNSRDGYFSNVALGKLPKGLPSILASLQVNQLKYPVSFGDQFLIIQLDEYNSSRLDPKMERRLLMAELSRWIEQMTPSLLARLQSSDN